MGTFELDRLGQVSIHAPVKGRPVADRTVPPVITFQSTPL